MAHKPAGSKCDSGLLNLAEDLMSGSCVATVSLLKDLKHANIVTLHDIIHTNRCLTLVFEYLVSQIFSLHSMEAQTEC